MDERVGIKGPMNGQTMWHLIPPKPTDVPPDVQCGDLSREIRQLAPAFIRPSNHTLISGRLNFAGCRTRSHPWSRLASFGLAKLIIFSIEEYARYLSPSNHDIKSITTSLGMLGIEIVFEQHAYTRLWVKCCFAMICLRCNFYIITSPL